MFARFDSLLLEYCYGPGLHGFLHLVAAQYCSTHCKFHLKGVAPFIASK